MQLKKVLLILLLGIIFVVKPILVFGLSCTDDSDCSAGYVCRNNICSVEQGLTITVTVPEGEEPEEPGGGGGGGEAPTSVVFKGRAYPKAFLTILRNGKVTATFLATESGSFTRTITGISGGVYTFGIFGEDTDGRKSVTLSFTVSVLGGTTTTISGIFLSPTISLTPTQIEKGGRVQIAGQVFPQSEVNIFIASEEIVKKTTATHQGKWLYGLDTSPLSLGEHSARSKALYGEGEQSPFSQTLPFLVVKPGAMVCKGADLNFDGRVDIVDFSILLYFWNQKNPANRCADINFDGIVNIFDFSIMMYWWTG